MIKFPMTFDVEASAAAGISTNWVAQANNSFPIPSAIPPEFMGPGGGYSPEDLFGIAIINCLIATYKVYCEKGKVSFQHIKAKAKVRVDKDPASTSFHVSDVKIFIEITGSSDVEKAKKLLETAIKDCAMSNSIKACKSFQTIVT